MGAKKRTISKAKSRVSAKKTAPPTEPDALNGKLSALLTLTEASAMLGSVHRTTIMRWVKENRLQCVRLSRKAIRFELEEIERFIREHRYSGR